MALSGRDERSPARRLNASMSVALGLGLGFFVLTTIIGVLGVGLVVGYQNTVDLLAEKAALIVGSQREQTTRFLVSTRNQIEYIAERIERGDLDPGGSEEFVSLLLGALSATPQIVRIQYVDRSYRLIGAERLEDEASPIFQGVRDDDDLKRLLDAAVGGASGHWGALLWRQEYEQAVLNYQQPVLRDGAVIGALSAWVSVRQVSEFLSDLQADVGANAFILYGDDAVLAHPLMAFGYEGLNRASPLPRQDRFADPVVSAMWKGHEGPAMARWFLSGPNVRFVSFGALDYVVLFETLSGFADRDLVVATYFRAHDLTSEAGRLKWAIALCVVMSVLSAAAAALIGRQIAQPVRRLADAARKVHELDLASVEPIPRSFFRELNDAGRSFDVMLDGLRWFERYVPRSLVKRLMEMEAGGDLASTHREVAVMFTDIVGFTTLSERFTAPETADFLNRHFSLVASCVEEEGGTVDKFIGDSVMALWGAPGLQLDAADRACRCALAIGAAIGAYNDARLADDPALPRVRMRIGIHLGRVVVGNIGSEERVNYTVVGDAVNVAHRLEQAGKLLGEGDADVTILVSDATRDGVTTRFRFTSLGHHRLRGREEDVEIFKLIG